ncbi:MAG: hypothetical protein ABI477_06095 [Chryseolinea sp.]
MESQEKNMIWRTNSQNVRQKVVDLVEVLPSTKAGSYRGQLIRCGLAPA